MSAYRGVPSYLVDFELVFKIEYCVHFIFYVIIMHF